MCSEDEDEKTNTWSVPAFIQSSRYGSGYEANSADYPANCFAFLKLKFGVSELQFVTDREFFVSINGAVQHCD